MSSASIEDIKFEKGPAKRKLTKQKAAELGAGTFTMRLHLYNDKKDLSRVFLSIIPGTIDALPNDIRHFNNLESFPVLSYPMYDRDGDRTQAELFPPAEPERKYGLYGLGVINSLAMPLVTDNLVLAVDPRQYITAIRYLMLQTTGWI